MRSPEPAAALAKRVGPAAPLVLDAAELAVRLRRTGAAHLVELRDAIVPAVPLLYVPELFARAKGVRGDPPDRRPHSARSSASDGACIPRAQARSRR